MSVTSPDYHAAWPERRAATSPVAGTPWSFRLAGARSARPAVEFYEAGTLLDVVSSTPIAPELVRGARAAGQGGRQRVLAWGRLPDPGTAIAVEFSSGTFRRRRRKGTVIEITGWCWLAVADGPFDRVTVLAGGCRLLQRVAGCRRWR